MTTVTGRLEKEFPGTNRNVTVQFLKDKAVGTVRPALSSVDGGGGVCAADCLRQRSAHADGTWRGTAARNRGARSVGREDGRKS